MIEVGMKILWCAPPRPRSRLVILGVLLIAVIAVAATKLLRSTPQPIANTALPLPEGLPADEVFASFRDSFGSALNAMGMAGVPDRTAKVDAFEHWCLEITNRRLLEGLSAEEIVKRLGPPLTKTWTPIDRRFGDSMSRYFVKKADYWKYVVYDPYAEERAGIAFAFYKGELWWSTYQRGRSTEKPKSEIYVDYVTANDRSGP